MSRPRLVVIGDVLLDIDTVGTVERVCPDAPAPVVDVAEQRRRPGGAGLAALLAAGDGAEVRLVAPLADDEAAGEVRALLEPHLEVVALPATGATPVKHRVLAGGRGVLRLDTGVGARPAGELAAAAGAALASADAVLVSDYGRGASADGHVRAALLSAAEHRPVIWDPHPRGAPPVPGVRLATPNEVEAAAATPRAKGRGLSVTRSRAVELVHRWRAAAVVVTLGQRGAFLAHGTGLPALLPARPVGEGDVCGAGDRFAARAAVSLAEGAVTLEAVEAAVTAATDFVAAGGAGAVEPRESGSGRTVGGEPVEAVVARVRARGGTVVATGGCFDLLHAGHVATLQAARRLGDCLVVCLNSDASVRRLKGPSRPLVAVADRARVLQALACVDGVVVFDEDTPAAVLSQLRPDVWVKGGDYVGVALPEQEVLARWGGQAVAVPYLRGRSTTGLMAAAAGIEL